MMAEIWHYRLLICLTAAAFVGNWVSGVRVRVEPKSEPVWYMEGGTLVLTCIVEGKGDLKPEWLINGEVARVGDVVQKMSKDSTVNPPRTTLTLIKNDATYEDSGSYFCSVNGGDAQKRVDMFSVTSRDVNLTLGFQTTLSCDIEPYYEKISITWFKGQTPLNKIPELEGRVTLGQFNKTVTIVNSKTSDTGLYKCAIKFNPDTEMEQTFSQTLGIQGKPHIISRSSQLQHLKNVTNTSIILSCPATGYPTPEVFWLRNDDVIEASDNYILSSLNGLPDTRLEIKDPTNKDYGSYVCVAENSIGKSQITIRIAPSSNSGISNTSWIQGTLAVFLLVFYVVMQ